MSVLSKMSLLFIFIGLPVLWVACDGDESPSSPTSPTNAGGQVSNTDSVAEASFSFERNVGGQTQLTVKGINGTITVTGSPDTNSVTITGVRRVGSESVADARENLENLEVRVTSQANDILVETVQPQQTGGRNYTVVYTITVPHGLNVSVTNVNGDVNPRRIVGNVSVELTNGQIDSRVTLPRDGTIELETTNGDVNLRIPQGTRAELSANLTNGTISVTGFDLQGQTSTGNSLQGTLGDGRGTISLRTVNGSINVIGF
jgi:DUF4097 and DUF4098 domain-containing protein YvlB